MHKPEKTEYILGPRIGGSVSSIRTWLACAVMSVSLNAGLVSYFWDKIEDVINMEYSKLNIGRGLKLAKNPEAVMDVLETWLEGREKGVSTGIDVNMVIKKMEALSAQTQLDEKKFAEETKIFEELYKKIVEVGTQMKIVIDRQSSKTDKVKSYLPVFRFIANQHGNYDPGLRRARDILIHGKGSCEARANLSLMAVRDIFGDSVRAEILHEQHVDDQTGESIGHVLIVVADVDGKKYRIDSQNVEEIEEDDFKDLTLQSPEDYIKGYLVSDGRAKFEEDAGPIVIEGNLDFNGKISPIDLGDDDGKFFIQAPPVKRLVAVKDLRKGLEPDPEPSKKIDELSKETPEEIAKKYGINLDQKGPRIVLEMTKELRMEDLNDEDRKVLNEEGDFRNFTELKSAEVVRKMLDINQSDKLRLEGIKELSTEARAELAKFKGEVDCPKWRPFRANMLPSRWPLEDTPSGEVFNMLKIEGDLVDLAAAEAIVDLVLSERARRGDEGLELGIDLGVDYATPGFIDKLTSVGGVYFRISGNPQAKDIKLLTTDPLQEVEIYKDNLKIEDLEAIDSSSRHLTLGFKRKTPEKPSKPFASGLNHLDLLGLHLYLGETDFEADDFKDLERQRNLQTLDVDIRKTIKTEYLDAILRAGGERETRIFLRGGVDINFDQGIVAPDFGKVKSKTLVVRLPSETVYKYEGNNFPSDILKNIGEFGGENLSLTLPSLHNLIHGARNLKCRYLSITLLEDELPDYREILWKVAEFEGARLDIQVMNGKIDSATMLKLSDYTARLKAHGYDCSLDEKGTIICKFNRE